MSYATEQAKVSRSVQWLVEITLDRCDNVIGSAPCTVSPIPADGLRCHYTYPTCQDTANFTRTTRALYFHLSDVPWPDPATVSRPFLRKMIAVPQKVRPKKLEVYPAKITLQMAYDWGISPLDHDKGSGKFNTSREGEFWRLLIARHRNYAGRPVRVLRGFNADGFVLADFEQVGPTYKLKEIKRSRSIVEIVAESSLADLKDRTLPMETGEDNTIQDVGGISATATSFDVLYGSDYPDPADYTRNRVYVGVEDEIMELESIAGNTLTVARGVLDTIASTHDEGDKVKHVLFIGTDEGNDPPTGVTSMAALQDLLEWIGVDASDVDTAAFDAIEESLWPQKDVQRILWRPKKAAKLVYELRYPRAIVMFMDEDDKWSVAVVGPGTSQGTYTEDHFVHDSVDIEEDEEDRATRAGIFYDPIDQDAGDNIEDYHKGIVHIDAELEQANNFGTVKEKNVVDPWLWGQVRVGIARNAAARLLTRFRYGQRVWSFELEIVHGDLDVGTDIVLQHSLIVDKTGVTEARPAMITSKKEVKRNINKYTAIDTGFSGLYFRIGSDDRAEHYDNSAGDERDSYWSDNGGKLGLTLQNPASVYF